METVPRMAVGVPPRPKSAAPKAFCGQSGAGAFPVGPGRRGKKWEILGPPLDDVFSCHSVQWLKMVDIANSYSWGL